jgi:NADH-quinone oxidoreductase subunit J
MSQYIFPFLAFLTILSALMVVFSKNPIHSVLYLVVCFFSIAGHYILLNAQFLAIVHIIVYAGAIMVLFLFVIMLLNLNAESEPHKPIITRFAAVLSGGVLFLTLIGSLKKAGETASGELVKSDVGLVKNLGSALFNEFLLPFEISSVLFISAMVGAVILAKKEEKA